MQQYSSEAWRKPSYLHDFDILQLIVLIFACFAIKQIQCFQMGSYQWRSIIFASRKEFNKRPNLL